ncbi:MAG TPA: efflux RND transporter periplasmic adaptor subunit [Levilinea sp.]|nr:efflux RND transporter periplasmic adaptor subunit [Levilinea sp.]
MLSIQSKITIKRTLLSRALMGFLAFILGFVTGCTPAEAEQAATPTPLPTAIIPLKPVYTVQTGEIVAKMQFSGRVVPVREEAVFFRTGGRVRNVYVINGDTVKAGEVLADLELLDDLERRLEMLELNVRRAEINLEIARLDYELFKANTPTWTSNFKLELAKQEAYLELQEIAYQEALLGKDDLEIAVRDARLTAPIDGVVNSFTLAPGRAVEAFANLAVIADMSELEVRAALSISDAGQLSEGMQVSLARPNRPGGELPGRIRRLPYMVTGGALTVEDQDSGTRISIDHPAGDFSPGDLMRCTVILEKKENVLWLPSQAIRTFEGRRFVVVKEGAVQQRVDVRLGIEGDGRVEIVEGLSEGQIVVSP